MTFGEVTAILNILAAGMMRGGGLGASWFLVVVHQMVPWAGAQPCE